MFKLTSWKRPKYVTLQVSLGKISRKLKKHAVTKFLGYNTHITKTENKTTEMRFLLMFKIDVLGTSQERQPLVVTLGPL